MPSRHLTLQRFKIGTDSPSRGNPIEWKQLRKAAPAAVSDQIPLHGGTQLNGNSIAKCPRCEEVPEFPFTGEPN